MKKVYKDRLKKLADHLINGKLGHKKFSFGDWNVNEDAYPEPYKCGYAGCAIGECPIVFKRHWAFNENGNPVLRQGSERLSLYSPATQSGKAFFGVDEEQFLHMFVPGRQEPRKFGGRALGDNAKAKSVANNILAFIAKQEGSK